MTNVFYATDNVNLLYSIIRDETSRRLKYNIGNEYIPELTRIMNMVVKRQTKNGPIQDKHIQTLNKSVLDEAIPFFINTIGMSVKAQRPSVQQSIGNHHSNRQVSPFQQPMGQFPPVHQPMGQAPPVQQPMFQQPMSQTGMGNDVMNMYERSLNERKTGSMPTNIPNFQDPVPEYGPSVNSLYEMEEQRRQQSDTMYPPQGVPDFLKNRQTTINPAASAYVQNGSDAQTNSNGTVRIPNFQTGGYTEGTKEDLQNIKDGQKTWQSSGGQAEGLNPFSPSWQNSEGPNQFRQPDQDRAFSVSPSDSPYIPSGQQEYIPPNNKVHKIKQIRHKAMAGRALKEVKPGDLSTSIHDTKMRDSERMKDSERMRMSIKKRNDSGSQDTVSQDTVSQETVSRETIDMNHSMSESSSYHESFNNQITTTYIIDSKDRNHDLYPDPHRYKIEIPNLRNINSIELLSAEIPKTSYIINKTNNTIHFQEQFDNVLEAELEPGNYTADELREELELAMNKATPSNITYTVEIDTRRGKFVLSSNAPENRLFNLIFYGGEDDHFETTRSKYQDRSIGPLLGFSRKDMTESKRYVAQNSYQLESDRYVFIYCNMFDILGGRTNDDDHLKEFVYNDHLCKVSLDVKQNEVKYYKQTDRDRITKFFEPPLENMSEITFEFRRYDGSYYNFNGHENSFVLEVTYTED